MSFAPPPKRTGTGLAPAPPPSTLPRQVITAPSKYQDPRSTPVELAPKISSERQLIEGAAPNELTPPSRPYRANTTGLSTDHLPPPPGRRDGADGRGPPSYDTAVAGMKALPAPSSSPAPSLPPRLPPRSGSGSSERSGSVPTPLGSDLLNKGAISRLGAAGISVPAFGIGSPANDTSSNPSPPPRIGGAVPNSQLNETQNRFSKLGVSSAPTTSNGGTTWAQKQAALKTASSLQKDPSSVSLSDARAAAGTANNFRQRHGDQVAAGLTNANNLNQKYGVISKVGAFAGARDQQLKSEQMGQQEAVAAAPPSVPGLAGKKKPPPPPPPKKKLGLTGSSMPPPPGRDDDAPPPVPMSTRPVF